MGGAPVVAEAPTTMQTNELRDQNLSGRTTEDGIIVAGDDAIIFDESEETDG